MHVKVHRMLVAEDVRGFAASVFVPDGVDDVSRRTQHAHGLHDFVLVEAHRVGTIYILKVAREVRLHGKGPVDVSLLRGDRVHHDQVLARAYDPRGRIVPLRRLFAVRIGSLDAIDRIPLQRVGEAVENDEMHRVVASVAREGQHVGAHSLHGQPCVDGVDVEQKLGRGKGRRVVLQKGAGRQLQRGRKQRLDGGSRRDGVGEPQ